MNLEDTSQGQGELRDLQDEDPFLYRNPAGDLVFNFPDRLQTAATKATETPIASGTPDSAEDVPGAR